MTLEELKAHLRTNPEYVIAEVESLQAERDQLRTDLAACDDQAQHNRRMYETTRKALDRKAKDLDACQERERGLLYTCGRALQYTIDGYRSEAIRELRAALAQPTGGGDA